MRFPIDFGVGHGMGCVATDRAIGLAQYLERCQLVTLANESCADIRDFFTEGRRSGGLAMGSGEHWQCGVLAGKAA